MTAISSIEKTVFKPYSEFLQEAPDVADDQGAGVVYLGWFKPAAGDGAKSLAQCKALAQWLICRITETAGVTVREWAGGNMSAYNQVWDDRAGITTYHLKNGF